MAWRVGSKVPLNVYDGDRPVCQCHNEDDALRIVLAVNEFNSLNSAKCQMMMIGGWCDLPLGHEGKHMCGTGN